MPKKQVIDKATIDRIFASADIVEVVSDFITLQKKGANYTACCPFHAEKTPSFVVSPAKGLYKCFGCGKGGGAVNFVMEQEKLSYPEALKWVARKYGIEIEEKTLTDEQVAKNNDRESMLVLNSWADSFFQKELFDTKVGRDVGLAYFKERGFTESTIKKFALGYCPESGARNEMSLQALKEGYKEQFLSATGLTIIKEDGGEKYYDRFAGRVIFPIHSLSGRIIGFGGRTMRTDKKTAKYLNSPQSDIYDKSQTLYGIFHAKKAISTLDKCILVEGYTDVIQMHQAGIENVVASSGTSLTEQQIKLIKRFTRNVTVIYDGDSAGIKASLRGIDMILRAGLNVRVVPLPEGDDPDSFARNHSLQQTEQYIEQHEEDFLSFKTRILLDGAKGDPIERAALINEIVNSIAVIPDPVARELYIAECSRAMDISADIISRSVATALVSQNFSTQEVRQVRGEQRSETEPIAVERSGVKVKNIDGLELELIGYLLKYGGENFKFTVSAESEVELSVAGTILDEIESDEIEFSNPLYNKVFKQYSVTFRAGEVPSMGQFLSNADPAVASLAADIASADEHYTISQMWERYEMQSISERERLSEAIPKAIVLYKSDVLSAKIAELRLAMAADLEGFDAETINRIKQLTQSRQAMAERYLRLM